MYEKYKDQGFVILGFPCNQFGSQEPWPEERIKTWTFDTFGRTFPLFSKVEVNGSLTSDDNVHPIFKFLKNVLPVKDGWFFTGALRWNFTKFLIGRDGVPISRHEPMTDPSAMVDDIEKALAALPAPEEFSGAVKEAQEAPKPRIEFAISSGAGNDTCAAPPSSAGSSCS